MGGRAERCQFPGSQQCEYEARKEAEAHAINDMHKAAAKTDRPIIRRGQLMRTITTYHYRCWCGHPVSSRESTYRCQCGQWYHITYEPPRT